MNQRNSKLFRKVFKDRQQYRAYKKAYTKASTPKKLETLKVVQEIVASGKPVRSL